jgi:hypothetical protein
MSTALNMISYLATQQRTICSIYPVELTETRRHTTVNPEGKLAAYKVYVLPAGSLEKPATLVVSATGDRCMDNTTEPSIPIDRPIMVDLVVDDLVRAFAQSQRDTDSGACPGIMAIAGTTPTKDELAQMHAKQEAYFRKLIHQADTFLAQDKAESITGAHRLAAKAMGTEDREWFKEVAYRPMKTCIACDKRISFGAKKCPECNTDLLEWGAKHGVTKDQDEVVWAALAPKGKVA